MARPFLIFGDRLGHNPNRGHRWRVGNRIEAQKLVVCIVHNRDQRRLSEALVAAEYKFTIIDSMGGFLRESSSTFLAVVDASNVQPLVDLVQANCSQREQIVNFLPLESGPAGAVITSPVRAPVGGAVVFAVDVDCFHRF